MHLRWLLLSVLNLSVWLWSCDVYRWLQLKPQRCQKQVSRQPAKYCWSMKNRGPTDNIDKRYGPQLLYIRNILFILLYTRGKSFFISFHHVRFGEKMSGRVLTWARRQPPVTAVGSVHLFSLCFFSSVILRGFPLGTVCLAASYNNACFTYKWNIFQYSVKHESDK